MRELWELPVALAGEVPQFQRMSTLTEIERAAEMLPRPEQEILLRHLSLRLRPEHPRGWPVPPPDVPREEIRRIQAEIDAKFSQAEPAE